MDDAKILEVDFNERDENGDVVAFLEELPQGAREGWIVAMTDAEGNSVAGQIARVDDEARLASIRPNWRTWVPASHDPATNDLHVVSGSVTVWFNNVSSPWSDDLAQTLKQRIPSSGTSVDAQVISGKS